MNKFSKLVSEIGNSFSINVNKLLAPRELKLYQLGLYTMPVSKEVVDLSEYFIDEEGDMYSLNHYTYFTKFGIQLKQLSNGANNQSGEVVNSLRGINGRKVTLRRKDVIAFRTRGNLVARSFDDVPIMREEIRTKNFNANKVG